MVLLCLCSLFLPCLLECQEVLVCQVLPSDQILRLSPARHPFLEFLFSLQNLELLPKTFAERKAYLLAIVVLVLAFFRIHTRPLKPLGPGSPGSPSSPFNPGVPGGPDKPGRPVRPTGPFGPIRLAMACLIISCMVLSGPFVDPVLVGMISTFPGGPWTPSKPGSPSRPGSPLRPGGPGGPGS